MTVINLRSQLELLEGRRRTLYLDSEGFWSIGVGRLLDPTRPGAGLRDKEVDFLLANDIEEATKSVLAELPWVVKLNEPRQAVIIGMAFQLGMEGLLAFKKTLAAARDEHWATAAAEMADSKWAKQTPARARLLARQMESGEWQ